MKWISRNGLENESYFQCNSPIADRLRQFSSNYSTPIRGKSVQIGRPTISKLSELAHHDAWFDVLFQPCDRSITLEGKIRVLSQSGRIFKIILKVSMSTLKDDLRSMANVRANENSETEEIKIDKSIILDKYEIGSTIGIGGYGKH